MPHNKFYRWELALMIALALTMLTGAWAGNTQQTLASHVVRLHVIANSDSQADQALKLEVRDAILNRCSTLIPPDATLEEAQSTLQTVLPDLSQIGQAVVDQAGYDYPVTASLEGDVWFPTKDYGTFALPAGDYTALRISIGQAQGQNWWCVVFPPLCTGAVSQPAVTVMGDGGLTPTDVALMTGENQGYVLKFKSIELWDEFKSWLDS